MLIQAWVNMRIVNSIQINPKMKSFWTKINKIFTGADLAVSQVGPSQSSHGLTLQVI
jgi:hypothetical protein